MKIRRTQSKASNLDKRSCSVASTTSSVGDIQSILDLSSAASQVRRDLHQAGHQRSGETLVPVLDNLVNSKLVNLDLLTPNQQRKSVIARSSRPSSTSTPSTSPARTPSVIRPLAPEIPTSPNISSISGEVFHYAEDSTSSRFLA